LELGLRSESHKNEVLSLITTIFLLIQAHKPSSTSK
jgi:hypothetical protein